MTTTENAPRTRRVSGPAFLAAPADVDLIVAVVLDRADADESAAKAQGAPRAAAASVRKFRALAAELAGYGTADASEDATVAAPRYEP